MSRPMENIRNNIVGEINGHNIYFDHRNYFVIVDGMKMVIDYGNNYKNN